MNSYDRRQPTSVVRRTRGERDSSAHARTSPWRSFRSVRGVAPVAPLPPPRPSPTRNDSPRQNPGCAKVRVSQVRKSSCLLTRRSSGRARQAWRCGLTGAESTGGVTRAAIWISSYAARDWTGYRSKCWERFRRPSTTPRFLSSSRRGTGRGSRRASTPRLSGTTWCWSGLTSRCNADRVAERLGTPASAGTVARRAADGSSLSGAHRRAAARSRRTRSVSPPACGGLCRLKPAFQAGGAVCAGSGTPSARLRRAVPAEAGVPSRRLSSTRGLRRRGSCGCSRNCPGR